MSNHYISGAAALVCSNAQFIMIGIAAMESRFTLLFDLDGLMIDSERIGHDSWRKAGVELGVPVSDALLDGLVGLAHGRTEAFATSVLGDADLARALRSASSRHYWHTLEHEEIPLKTGIHELLSWVAAQNITRAVATSTQRTLLDLKLARSGLQQYFSVTVAGDEVTHTKPAPDLYPSAAAKLGVAPERCIVLEDSIYGLQAGRAAGMQVILVPDLAKPEDVHVSEAQAVCEDLHQALTALKPLFV